MAKKSPRARTMRRAAAQTGRRVAARLERVAAQLPGASADRALRVTSASVIEVRARATQCLACEGELDLQAHVADGPADTATRRIDLVCRRCHTTRHLWFRIEAPVPN
jgi:hypothetical protein